MCSLIEIKRSFKIVAHIYSFGALIQSRIYRKPDSYFKFFQMWGSYNIRGARTHFATHTFTHILKFNSFLLPVMKMFFFCSSVNVVGITIYEAKMLPYVHDASISELRWPYDMAPTRHTHE